MVLGCMELTRSPRRRDVTRGTADEDDGEAAADCAAGVAEDEAGVATGVA